VTREELCKNFDILEISISGLHKHITEKCWLSLKNATKYTRERDSPHTIDLRNEIVSEWKRVGVDFQKNFVFIDEAGFHSQMMRNRVWSRKGVPAIVKIHTQKGFNVSIVGCIASFGIVNFSKVDPIKKVDAKIIEREF
ncbi:uncharacterized protein B0P05DRAFT_443637, partial [Gilbertella persicaria]|uniref:uncharacterized protein n=1 Tax=Gilbertella persicaria TaxID=101096 RepID=UPI00222061C4